jgi:hypothetical protein
MLVASEHSSSPSRSAPTREIDRADDHLAVALQAHQHRVQRHAAHEGLGAVDRVEDPAVGGAGARLALLLAQDAVAGVAGLDQLAHQPLRGAVGRRHGRLVLLQLGGQVGLEVAQGQLAGLPCQVGREVAQVAQGFRCHEGLLL